MSQLLSATDRQFVVAAQLTPIKAKCCNTYLNYRLFRITHDPPPFTHARAFRTARLPACHENCLGNCKVLLENLASRFPKTYTKDTEKGVLMPVKHSNRMGRIAEELL